MKKYLLTMMALGAMLSASAGLPGNLSTLQNKPLIKDVKGLELQSKPATRAAESFEFGYCFDIYDGVGLQTPGAVMEGVMEIPKELAQKWKGQQVTAVDIAFGQSSNKIVNVYITKDLDGVPEYMQEATMIQEIAWNKVDLKTPYTIDGDGFYIGYQAELKQATDYPLVIDGVYTTLPYGDIIGVFMGGEDDGYYNFGDMFGSVCLRAEISGNNLPQFGCMINTLYMDQTLAQVDESFGLSFSIVNTGTKSIYNADITCKVNGKEVPVEVKVLGEGSTNPDIDEGSNDLILPGTNGFINLTGISASEVGNNKIDIIINKLSDQSGASGVSGTAFSTEILVVDETFDKAFVVEEYTGTWCIWCPRGIVQMAEMEENYGDKNFIGIAVHYGDAMEAASYSALGAYYYQSPGFPAATINRVYTTDMASQTLMDYYEAYGEEKSPIKVEVDADYDEDTNTLTCKATTTFGFDMEDPNYVLTFVLTENNVGPYSQSNAYSGGKYGPMDGWENKGANVATIYNEVARFITGTGGIQNSIPASVVKGTPYDYSFDLDISQYVEPITAVDGKKVPFKVNNGYLIALVLDTQSGEIMNGAKMSLKGMAGVESILAEPEDGVYRVYNLQGVKMLETQDATQINNLSAGIYIINGKKALVK